MSGTSEAGDDHWGRVVGLSAGIFAQLNGFASTIIEQHHTLGSECTFISTISSCVSMPAIEQRV